MDQVQKYDRVPVSIIAHYRDPSSFRFVHEQCRDLTPEGVFIQTADPVPAGALLKLKCEIEGEPKGISVVARVARVVHRESGEGIPGMEVRFIKLEAGSAEVIARVLSGQVTAAVEPAEQPFAGVPRQEEPAAVSGPGPKEHGGEDAPATGSSQQSAVAEASEPAEPADERGRVSERERAERVAAEAGNTAGAASVSASQRPAARAPVGPGEQAGPAEEAAARAEAGPESSAGRERDFTFYERLRKAWSERPSAPPPADESESGEPEAGKTARPGQTSISKKRLSSLSSLQVNEDYSVPFAWKKLAVPAAALLALGVAFTAYMKYEATRPVVPARATMKAGGSEKPVPEVKADSPAPESAAPELAAPESPAPERAATTPPQEQPAATAGDSRAKGQAKEASRPSQAASGGGSQRRAQAKEASRRAASPTPEPAAAAPSGEAVDTSPPSALPEAGKRDRTASRSSTKAEAGDQQAEGAGAKDSPPEPAAAAAESKQPKMYIMQPTAPIELATACVARGDNACVIRVLEGRARSERELQLLIETYRSIGDNEAAHKKMADYVRRYPSATRAGTYRKILERKKQ